MRKSTGPGLQSRFPTLLRPGTVIFYLKSNLEKQIDKLVYELYELTPEEIKIVEVAEN